MSVRLIDRLTAARRHGFVGRKAELQRFSAVLNGSDESQVVYVHGPGGIGKTALLYQFAWIAEQAGRRAIWLDGRELPADSAAVLRALHHELEGEDSGDPLQAICQAKNVVLFIDTYESLASLDRWIREAFVPYLPAEWMVVLAGRNRPSLGWRADPGWRELLADLPLGNLAESEGREMLRRRGIPDSRHRATLSFTRGHPLALALVADVPAQEGLSSPVAAPEVVASLLRGFVDTVPSAEHRRALEACAQVMVLSESLLAALLGRADVDGLFEWLRELSIVEHGSRGLYPHDLVRDVLVAEMRWRDSGHCEEMRACAADYYRERLRTAEPEARLTLLLDYLYLHRERSVLGSFLGEISSHGLGGDQFAITSPSEGQWALMRSWVEGHEGPDSALLFDHWRVRQPEAFKVIHEGSGEPAGFFAVLRLEHTDQGDRRADPAVDRVLPHLPALGDGETALLVRFWLAADVYQALSPVQIFITLYLTRSYLTTPFLAATFLAFADPEPWAEGCARLDYHRLPEADFRIGSGQFGVYGHDWRHTSPLRWLSELTERETGETLLGETPALGREAFGEAVRDALRNLGRADGLRDSALLDSRLVTARAAASSSSSESRTAALRELLEAAAARLADSPHDRRAHRALHHTYVQPAGSQQRAAELLGLPMSTFRRHLAIGIDRITTLLWDQECSSGTARRPADGHAAGGHPA